MGWQTHDITNQVSELQDYNIFQSDPALKMLLNHYHANWHAEALDSLGARLGSAATLELAHQANRFPPELVTHDRRGHRIDQVQFHPAWHTLMSGIWTERLHNLPWQHEHPGAHVARAAAYYLQGQIESGSLCPTTMTFAAIPVLRNEPKVYETLQNALLSDVYDARDLPISAKRGIVLGMGMTEKQGGSDVRTNTTHATAIGVGGRGGDYRLTGHKWFFSAPMCDAHLVLAHSKGGLSCFLVPRWAPDGQKNAIHIQRLKDKLGNRSNSSSEVEFHDAYGIMIGEEGRGIPTIIEMANHTRLDCIIGSSALMRHALVQAIHHARERRAFGKRLVDQALMRNVLCDLAIESEAALHLMLRIAHAQDAEDSPLERAWRRIVLPAAKFSICKRAIAFTGEAMEVWGGNGYVESGPMARMYREAPVNSIWEGSGNVMCLDVLRAIGRERDAAEALWGWLASGRAGDESYDTALTRLEKMLSRPDVLESQARRFSHTLVLCCQYKLLREGATTEMADSFVSSRLGADSATIFGGLETRIIAGHDMSNTLLERAWPANC